MREAQRLEAGGFVRRMVISDNSLFSSYEIQPRAEGGQDCRAVIQGCTGPWTAGCRFARQLRRLKASIAMDIGTTLLLLISSWRVALRNLDLLIKTDWSLICLALLLRALAVGRLKQSESIGADLDEEAF